MFTRTARAVHHINTEQLFSCARPAVRVSHLEADVILKFLGGNYAVQFKEERSALYREARKRV